MFHVTFLSKDMVPLLANRIKAPTTYHGYCLSDQLVRSHKTVTIGESFLLLLGKEETTYRKGAADAVGWRKETLVLKSV